jgi:uroporphyrinogen-III decarboxylase
VKEMNSKERALTAFAHQKPDRVPINYLSNPGIDLRLKAHYGLAADDDEGLRRKIWVDFRRIDAPYIGPQLHADVPERQVDMWGIHRRWIEHESGGYWDYCDFPLKEASLDLIENWPMPSADDFDYAHVTQQCRLYQDYCCMAGNPGVGDMSSVIPSFLAAGINCMHPVEPVDNMDIVELRAQYGQRLAFYGGLDKHVLREGKEAIAAELEHKMPPLIKSGGCVLALDHRIPNATPLENYRFYIEKSWEIIERES